MFLNSDDWHLRHDLVNFTAANAGAIRKFVSPCNSISILKKMQYETVGHSTGDTCSIICYN